MKRISTLTAIIFTLSTLIIACPSIAGPKGHVQNKNNVMPIHTPKQLQKYKKIKQISDRNTALGNKAKVKANSKSIIESLRRLGQNVFNDISSNRFKSINYTPIKKTHLNTVEAKLYHGDPKTTYHKSENRYHSLKQRERADVVVEPEIQTIDLSTWELKNQFLSSDGKLNTYFNPPADSEYNYDYILIISSAETNIIESVSATTTTTSTEKPVLDGMELVLVSTAPDGTYVETWLKLADGETDWSKATMRIKITYNPDGSILESEMKVTETLDPETFEV
ncbi:MAG: hypothetical protein ACI9CF_000173 [Candidatus Omnitrophota bacterium]